MAADDKPKLVKPRLHPTRNNIESNARNVSISLLNHRLADGLDLALITKQAHWNLKGPQFIGVHEMLDGFRTDQDDWNDKMAERITALGGTAYGTTQDITRNSKLEAYPTDIYRIADHLAALIDRYAAFGNTIPRKHRRDRRGRRRRYCRPFHRGLPAASTSSSGSWKRMSRSRPARSVTATARAPR